MHALHLSTTHTTMLFNYSPAFAIPMLLLQSALGAVFHQEIDESPRAPGQCYFSSNGVKTFFAAESLGYDNDRCLRYSCYRSSPHKWLLTAHSCGTVGTEPPCYVSGRRPGRYPECCPTVVCPPQPEPQPAHTHNSAPSSAHNQLFTHGKQ